ncbi:hypothetical protein KDK_25130 [Dictyobacter kobayashii]|uniref:Uncharacterized protein n=1 Tax=Dictyobacter kobayashii TaxID=2014872 RepID=A0A402AI29_9CHLR|nr:hypothetical protein KDK_25130 [Dictyobacter kobayashii]
MPAGNYVIDATIPTSFHTSNGQISCTFTITSGTGSTDGATTVATSSTSSGGGEFGIETLPLTSSVKILTADPVLGATVNVQCTIKATIGGATQTATISGVSISADRKNTLNGNP